MKKIPRSPPFANPFRRGSRGWGGLICHRNADVVANGTTMVNVYVGWLIALVSSQTLLSLHEETYDKVDNETFVSTRQILK